MKHDGLKLIPAPIDNKNLMEDPFEDEIFGDFYAAEDHRKNGKRHLIGHKKEWSDCLIDVSWEYGYNLVKIAVLAVPAHEDFETVSREVFECVRETFSQWECEDNPHLHVHCVWSGHTYPIWVYFFFDME